MLIIRDNHVTILWPHIFVIHCLYWAISIVEEVLLPQGAIHSAIASTQLHRWAAATASANGIAVSTIRHDRRCDYETLLRVTVSHGGGERTIAGTLVGGDKARIVEVQHIPVESDFPDNLLYLRNYDKPGFIGALGSMMGELSVNIATFHLGRKEAGGEAVALIEIDGSVTHDTLQSIRAMPQVVRADYLQFSA